MPRQRKENEYHAVDLVLLVMWWWMLSYHTWLVLSWQIQCCIYIQYNIYPLILQKPLKCGMNTDSAWYGKVVAFPHIGLNICAITASSKAVAVVSGEVCETGISPRRYCNTCISDLVSVHMTILCKCWWIELQLHSIIVAKSSLDIPPRVNS